MHCELIIRGIRGLPASTGTGHIALILNSNQLNSLLFIALTLLLKQQQEHTASKNLHQ